MVWLEQPEGVEGGLSPLSSPLLQIQLTSISLVVRYQCEDE